MSSKNALFIDGERYLPTKKAAKEVRYSYDYVGQLAREGRIDAKKHKGAWYVSMASLDKYKRESKSQETSSTERVSQPSKDVQRSQERGRQGAVKSIDGIVMPRPKRQVDYKDKEAVENRRKEQYQSPSINKKKYLFISISIIILAIIIISIFI